jgi:hypothetical protein
VATTTEGFAICIQQFALSLLFICSSNPISPLASHTDGCPRTQHQKRNAKACEIKKGELTRSSRWTLETRKQPRQETQREEQGRTSLASENDWRAYHSKKKKGRHKRPPLANSKKTKNPDGNSSPSRESTLRKRAERHTGDRLLFFHSPRAQCIEKLAWNGGRAVELNQRAPSFTTIRT